MITSHDKLQPVKARKKAAPGLLLKLWRFVLASLWRPIYFWLRNRSDIYLLACWLILGTAAGYQRLAVGRCAGSSGVLPDNSPLATSFPCNGSAIERSVHMLRQPVQVYRDLLWDAPQPIRWVQGQIVAVGIRFAAVVLLPPAAYRTLSPWLVAGSRAVAPACLVADAWWPAVAAALLQRGQPLEGAGGAGADGGAPLMGMLGEGGGSGGSGRGGGGGGALAQRPGDEYIEFSLRWYPLMDVAFTCMHPTSVLVEIVYGIFSLCCVLAMGLPGPPGRRLPRGFFLPLQLIKCLTSSLALLAIERWRLMHHNANADRSGSNNKGKNHKRRDGAAASSPGGSGSGSQSGSRKCSSNGGHVGSRALKGEVAAATEAPGGAGSASGGGGICCSPFVDAGGEGCGDFAAGGGTTAAAGRGDYGGGTRQECACGALTDPRVEPEESSQGDHGLCQREQHGQLPPEPPQPANALLHHHEQLQQEPPAYPRRLGSSRAGGSLRLVAVETRRLRGPAAGSASGAGTGDGVGTGGGAEGRGLTAVAPQRGGETPLALLAAYHASVQLGQGPLVASASDGSSSSPPQMPLAAVQQQQQMLLHTRRLPAYTPFRYARHHAAGGPPGNPRDGGRTAPPLPPPPPPSHRASTEAASPASAAAATAPAGALGASLPLPLHAAPGHVPYTTRTVVYSTRIKLEGCEPEQVPPGYTERIGRVVAAAGMQLEAVALRRGCIELLIEARAIDGAAPTAPPAGVAAVEPRQLLRPTTAPAAAAHASSSATPQFFASGSDCRWTHGQVSSSALGWDGSSASCADADAPAAAAAAPNPEDPFGDVLDIGALIRALQLPESPSLETDGSAPASDAEGNGGGGSGDGDPATAAVVAVDIVTADGAAAANDDGEEDAECAAAGAVTDPRVGSLSGQVEAGAMRARPDLWCEAWVASSSLSAAPAAAAGEGTRTGTASSLPASTSSSQRQQLLLPYISDVYPRVLLVPSLAAAAAASSSNCEASASASALIMAVSWVASSLAAVHGLDAGLDAAAPPVDVAAPSVAAAPDLLPATAATDPRVIDGGGDGDGGGAGFAPGSQTRQEGVTDAAQSATAAAGAIPAPPTPSAQILLRSHGEMVAVALVTASAAAAADAVASAATQASAAATAEPPMLAAPDGADAGDAAGGDCSSADGCGRSSASARTVLAPPPPATASAAGHGGFAGGGAAATLSCEALYSMDVSPLLARLRPGVVLVEAQPDPSSPLAAAATAAVARRAAAAVPVMAVDDPRVARELQQVLEVWYGTADELDSLLYDMGALTRLQDELTACAGGALAAAAAAGDGDGGGAALHLSAMSARTQLLYSHLASYTEAMSWEAVGAWLATRQQAATAAVAAANAAAAALPPPPAERRSAARSGTGTAAAVAAVAATPAELGSSSAAAAPGVDSPDEARRGPSSSFQRLMRLLLVVVLGWRTEGEADAAAYAAYTAQFAASMMNVMQVMDLLGFLTVMTRSASANSGTSSSPYPLAPPSTATTSFSSSSSPSTSASFPPTSSAPSSLSWLDPDKACVLVAASTGVVLGAMWLVLPRPAWRRASAAAKWPRQVSYTLSKAMVAFLGFPQPPSTLRHELGFTIFVVEGVILPAAVLMSPLESVAVGLLRAPLCARMWLLADGGAHHTTASAALRALALAALNVLTTVAVHLYIRMSYERERRSARHAKED